MIPDPETILQLSQSVCETMLDVQADTCATNLTRFGRSHTAYTAVSGAWNGLVAIDCPAEIACRAAVVMFDQSADRLTLTDVHDGVLEMANIVGGNIKALLPEPSKLSVPDLADREIGELFPKLKPLSRVDVPANGSTFRVTLWAEAA